MASRRRVGSAGASPHTEMVVAQGSSNLEAGEPLKDQGDIETQLDTLLAEIKGGESTPAADIAAPIAAEKTAAAEQHATVPTSAPAGAPPTTDLKSTAQESDAAAASNPGDDLAKQIQDLLDTAKASSAPHAAPAVESSAAAPPVPAVTATKAAAPAAAAPVAAVATAPVVAPTPAAATPTPAPTKANIDHLDKELAANADNAVAGDFETVAEVSGKSPGGDIASQSGDTPADQPDAVNEPALEGGFASPEELFEEKPFAVAAKANEADAKAVAKELDEQPERAAAKRPKVAVAAASDATIRVPRKGRGRLMVLVVALAAACAAFFYFKPWERVSTEAFTKLPWQVAAGAAAVGVVAALLWLKRRRPRGAAADASPETTSAGSPLFRVMVALNSPLLALKPSTRNMIGWVGLLTLFNGSTLLMCRAVFHITGGAPNAAVASEGHGESGGHGEAAGYGESSGHGAKKAEASGHGEASGGHGEKPKAKKPDPKAAHGKKPDKKAKADAHGGGH